MEIRSLTNISDEIILKVFNESFSDYIIPFQLTLEQLTYKLKSDLNSKELSVGVFEQDSLVAFILHGIQVINNKKVVYNGGTGVIPSKRGNRLVGKMYAHILDKLKKQNIDYVQLEVIKGNEAAIRSYDKFGFSTIRSLYCYKGEIHIVDRNLEGVQCKQDTIYDWELFQSFWDIQPSWQNSINVLETIKDNLTLQTLTKENQTIGYIIYNEENGKIYQFAIDKNHRRKGYAKYLFTMLAKYLNKPVSITNVDNKATHIHQFLKQIGMEHFITQYEMYKEL